MYVFCGTVSVVQARSYALDLLLAPLGRATGAVSTVFVLAINIVFVEPFLSPQQ